MAKCIYCRKGKNVGVDGFCDDCRNWFVKEQEIAEKSWQKSLDSMTELKHGTCKSYGKEDTDLYDV